MPNEVVIEVSQEIVLADATKTTKVTVKEPKARCIYEFGSPFNDDGTINFPVMRKWVIECTGISENALNRMALKDATLLNEAIVDFLAPAASDSKTSAEKTS